MINYWVYILRLHNNDIMYIGPNTVDPEGTIQRTTSTYARASLIERGGGAAYFYL